jgi:hypothetical protein
MSRILRRRFGGPAPATLPLDNLTIAPAVAWGPRKLRTAYAGACCTVYKITAGTNTDIGFDGSGVMDWAALDAFIGASDTGRIGFFNQAAAGGFQMRNGNLNLLPAAIVAGTTYTRNGIRMPLYNGARPETGGAGLTGGNFSAAIVGYRNAAASVQALISGNANAAFLVRSETGRSLSLLRSNVASILNTGATVMASNTLHQFFASGGSTGTQTLELNGTNITSVGGQTYANIYVAGYDSTTGTSAWADCIAEHIIWTSVISDADRNAIAANQKAYYGTP